MEANLWIISLSDREVLIRWLTDRRKIQAKQALSIKASPTGTSMMEALHHLKRITKRDITLSIALSK